MRHASTLLLPALLLSVACDPMEEPQVGEEACEHFENGPFEDVTATDAMGGAPDISGDHMAHRVATVELDADGNRGGYVTYESGTDGMTTFFMSHHFDIVAMDASDTMIMPDKSVHEVEACDGIAMFHVFPLGVGTYTLDIGPTQEETVTMVWQLGDAAEGDTGQHDHDMDHSM